ncbi:zinc transporter ZupT [Candidatus Gracilibacteria bacterium]|nr:zinc transporter ZupT [Candidatus Gracilibacteria bacterium]MCF7856479.1 zinc transporter ZupT [Candidatus Gracilibacteria bacterium]MCF7896775.1 zinc transporter ZupT [Candidatus Gracilibacteria bacterium]
MNYEALPLAFALTLFAGLSTGIGGALVCLTKRTNTKVLSIALGFSAGVMIYVSFMEILPEASKLIGANLGILQGGWITLVVFFGGILLSALIDKSIPAADNPHEIHKVEEAKKFSFQILKKKKLLRMGIFTTMAIALHNFPEGLVTFISTMQDVRIGIPIAIAVAIHNIPEGIAIAIPFYHATGSRKKAFVYSLLSGLAEPLGALVGCAFFFWLLNGLACGILLAAVAGVMIFISFDELLPTAREYGEHHLSLYGLIGGMGTMAVSLLLLV